MAEVAAGGGCLTLDPNNPDEIADAFERLATDEALSERLRTEIDERSFQTWDAYAGSLLDDIAATLGRPRSFAGRASEVSARSRVAG